MKRQKMIGRLDGERREDSRPMFLRALMSLAREIMFCLIRCAVVHCLLSKCRVPYRIVSFFRWWIFPFQECIF